MRSLPGCGPSSGTVVDIVCNRQDSGVTLNSSVTALQASGAAVNLTSGPQIWRPVINLACAAAVVWLLLLR